MAEEVEKLKARVAELEAALNKSRKKSREGPRRERIENMSSEVVDSNPYRYLPSFLSLINKCSLTWAAATGCLYRSKFGLELNSPGEGNFEFQGRHHPNVLYTFLLASRFAPTLWVGGTCFWKTFHVQVREWTFPVRKNVSLFLGLKGHNFFTVFQNTHTVAVYNESFNNEKWNPNQRRVRVNFDYFEFYLVFLVWAIFNFWPECTTHAKKNIGILLLIWFRAAHILWFDLRIKSAEVWMNFLSLKVQYSDIFYWFKWISDFLNHTNQQLKCFPMF